MVNWYWEKKSILEWLWIWKLDLIPNQWKHRNRMRFFRKPGSELKSLVKLDPEPTLFKLLIRIRTPTANRPTTKPQDGCRTSALEPGDYSNLPAKNTNDCASNRGDELLSQWFFIFHYSNKKSAFILTQMIAYHDNNKQTDGRTEKTIKRAWIYFPYFFPLYIY